MMKRKRVAVIGAAGQVGSVLVRRLSELENVDVVATCRNTISAGLIHFSYPHCDIRVGSVAGRESARRLLGDCEAVINCALPSGAGSRKVRASSRLIIDGIASLENLNLFIHFSSISVYGDFIWSGTKSTFLRPLPDNEYGRSKLDAEQYAREVCESKGLTHYLIRLGHVIGAGTDRSREIVEFSKSPRFGLPFDGSLPSNTVHVERLASMIGALVSSPGLVPAGIYNIAEQGKTWGDVYDWHTNSLGLPAVARIPSNASEPMRSAFMHRSIFRESAKWVRGLPFLSLVKSPAILDLAVRLLGHTPERLTARLFHINRQMGTKRQLAALSNTTKRALSPVYLSEAMPGTYLSLSNGSLPPGPSEEETREDLRKWHRAFSQPPLLAHAGNSPH